MINANQLRQHVIVPALQAINSHSYAAVNLLMGTCAHESEMGHYLHQVKGPALGIFQMEPATYHDIWENYLAYKPELANLLKTEFGGSADNAEQMVYDLRYAAAMCRVHYLRQKSPLPDAIDVFGMAHYWKKYYNTELGKGTVERFVRDYKRYVQPGAAV